MIVYIDTSAIIAVMDAADHRNFQASKTWERLVMQGSTVVISNYAVIETLALLHARSGMAAAKKFSQGMLSVLNTHYADESFHMKCISTFLVGTSKSSPSLVDCASFLTMRELGISMVFAYDPHFSDQGFTVIG